MEYLGANLAMLAVQQAGFGIAGITGTPVWACIGTVAVAGALGIAAYYYFRAEPEPAGA